MSHQPSEPVVQDTGRQRPGAGGSGRGLAGLFLLVLGAVLATGAGHLFVQDEVALYHMTASFLEGGRFDVPRYINTGGGFVGLDGRYYSPFGIGQPLLAWPLLALARLGLLRIGAPYLEVVVLSAFNAFVLAASAVVLARLLMDLGAVFRRAAGVSLACAFGTHAFLYARTFFAEPLTALLGLVALRALLLARRGAPRQAAVAGLAAGFAVLVRFFGVLLLPVYGLYLLWPDGRPARARLRQAAVYAGCAGLFVGVCLLRNRQLLGSWYETGYQLLPTGAVRGFTHPVLPGLGILLLAPGKSLFVFAPPVLLGLALLPRWLRRHPAEGVLVLLVAAVHLVGYAHWCSPEAGYSWGPRFLVPIVGPLLLPLSDAGLGRRGKAALALLALAGLAVGSLALPVDFAQRLRVRSQEYYLPDGSYNFWFTPYADHLSEAARVAPNVSPTSQTVGRSRRHLIPDWTGEPDLWFVHLLREGHRPGPVLGVLGAELLLGAAGAALLLGARRR